MSEAELLEDEVELDEELTSEEDPNDTFISDDLDKIEEYEAQLLDIVTTLEAMEKADGVCRQHMVSFEHLLPEEYPLSSFTQNPSQTNYEVARTTLEAFNWKIAAGIAAAVATLIASVVAWLLNRKSKGDNKGSKDTLKDKAKQVEKKVKRINIRNPNFPQVRKANEGNQQAVQAIDAFASKLTIFNQSWNAYSEQCLLKPGTYIKTLFDVAEMVLVDHTQAIFDYVEGTWTSAHIRELVSPEGGSGKDVSIGTLDEGVMKIISKLEPLIKLTLTQNFTQVPGLLVKIRTELMEESKTVDTETLLKALNANKYGLSDEIKNAYLLRTNEKARKNIKRLSTLPSILDKAEKNIIASDGKHPKNRLDTPAARWQRGIQNIRAHITFIQNYAVLLEHAITTEANMVTKATDLLNATNRYISYRDSDPKFVE